MHTIYIVSGLLNQNQTKKTTQNMENIVLPSRYSITYGLGFLKLSYLVAPNGTFLYWEDNLSLVF